MTDPAPFLLAIDRGVYYTLDEEHDHCSILHNIHTAQWGKSQGYVTITHHHGPEVHVHMRWLLKMLYMKYLR